MDVAPIDVTKSERAIGIITRRIQLAIIGQNVCGTTGIIDI